MIELVETAFIPGEEPKTAKRRFLNRWALEKAYRELLKSNTWPPQLVRELRAHDRAELKFMISEKDKREMLVTLEVVDENKEITP